MKLTFLGTAAAEGWPALFCRCEHCLRAQKAGGKNIRTRSQALINSDLLIDFPGDTYHHFLTNKLDLSAVKYLFVTHSHLDHFAPWDLFFRSDSYYAHSLTEKELYLYANEAVNARLKAVFDMYDDEPKNLNLLPAYIPLYSPITAGEYTVTALKAHHAAEESAYTYHITDGKSSLLYLHDTGRLYDDVYDYLKQNHIKADFISFDCTYGLLKSGGGHLGLDSCIEERDRLIKEGITKDGTRFALNHFSHNGKAIYDELVPIAAEQGFLVSYDGMEIEF